MLVWKTTRESGKQGETHRPPNCCERLRWWATPSDVLVHLLRVLFFDLGLGARNQESIARTETSQGIVWLNGSHLGS